MNKIDALEKLLILEQSGKGIKRFFEDNDVKNVAVYGLGRIGLRTIEALRKAKVEISYCIDRDAAYMESDELNIITPEILYLLKDNVELIIVSPCEEYYEIKEEIEKHVHSDIISIAEIIEYCLDGEKYELVRRKPQTTTSQGSGKSVFCTIAVSNMNKCLNNRTILVTGGSSGIGKATVEKICNEGGTAIAVGRNEKALYELQDQTGCLIVIQDLREIEDYSSFFEQMEDVTKGKIIDSFVNNAGIYIERKIGDYSINDFEEMSKTNFEAAYMLLQAFVSYCKKKGIKGNSVYTGSIRGMWGDPGLYGIMKSAMLAAVIGYARATANEGMRINAVSPGMTASGINGLSIADNLFNDDFLGKRILISEEISETIVWLLSDYSAGVTGANIPCSYGSHLEYRE